MDWKGRRFSSSRFEMLEYQDEGLEYVEDELYHLLHFAM